MSAEQESFRFNRSQTRSSQPPGLLGKLLAFVLGAILLVLAFMFSLVVLAVVAVGGLLAGGWLWWKTRAIRQQLREQITAAADEGNIIEGEAVREDGPPSALLR